MAVPSGSTPPPPAAPPYPDTRPAGGPPLGRRPFAYYERPRPDLLAAIPRDAAAILDVGCAAGWLGAALRRERPDVSVTGVERDPDAARLAATRLDRVECLDVERAPLPFRPAEFDCIVYGDVLEHLVDPWGVLHRHLRLLRPNGSVVLSLPNLRQLGVLLKLALLGRFEYIEEGILDATHLRFFTLREIRGWLAREGLRIERIARAHGFWKIQGAAARALARVPGLRELLTVRYTVTARR
jgi:2-polyprenyl-3-methyl-5-hydroxy-6-metoxy-1,4-benzoquinol methylase